MGYGVDIEIFEKIIFKGIKSNEETMAFLTEEATEILNEEKSRWKDQLENKDDLLDPELWCEFTYPASKKLDKFLCKWFDDMRMSLSLDHYEKKLPYELREIFLTILDEIGERVCFESFADEMIEDILEQNTLTKVV